MRSALAKIIAIAALLPLIPSVLAFLESTQRAFQFHNTSMLGNAWLMLGQALLAPLSLFATAAIVEMLFRISTALPNGIPRVEQSREKSFWPWRNPIANAFLVVAALAYVASGAAALSYMAERGAAGLEPDQEQGARMVMSLSFFWLTSSLEIIAWAAVIEHLSRISSALRAPPGPRT